MNEDQIIQKLKVIFGNIFSENNFILSRDLSADDVDEWDSLTHINIIVAIEKEFEISFTLDELEEQNCVGDTIDMILKKI